MKVKKKVLCLTLALLCGGGAAQAQQQEAAATPDSAAGKEPRVALTEAATAFDAEGRVALGARLRTTQLGGAADAPARNVLLVVENRGQFFYSYASGWATFYGGDGVRCGEGLWKTAALAPGETVEVDTPGLRLTCAPATWRVVAVNLLTRSTDVAKPGQPAPAADAANATAAAVGGSGPAQPEGGAGRAAGAQRLEININGKTLPLQLGNPLDVVVGKERLRIVVQPAP